MLGATRICFVKGPGEERSQQRHVAVRCLSDFLCLGARLLEQEAIRQLEAVGHLPWYPRYRIRRPNPWYPGIVQDP